MIFPLVAYPCKFCLHQILDKFPPELQSKVAQCNAAGQVYHAEKVRRDKFAPPRDQSCHDETPEDGTCQKAGEENGKMDRFRLP